jgi:hypothetical protein
MRAQQTTVILDGSWLGSLACAEQHSGVVDVVALERTPRRRQPAGHGGVDAGHARREHRGPGDERVGDRAGDYEADVDADAAETHVVLDAQTVSTFSGVSSTILRHSQDPGSRGCDKGELSTLYRSRFSPLFFHGMTFQPCKGSQVI